MKKLVLFFLTIFISVGCEKDAFNENFDFLYGDWTPIQINVGMSSPNPSIVGDIIQFIKDDTYTIKKDNKIMESGKIVIEKQTPEELTLRLKAKKVDSSYNPSIKVSGRSLTVNNTVSSSLCLSNLATDAGFFGICLLKTN